MAATRKRRDVSSSGSSGAQEPKKSIPGPTDFKQFVVMMVMYMCKKSLFLDPKFRVGAYLIAGSAGAMIFDVFRAPRSLFSRKDSFLNVYFAKLSWFWTSILVGPFIFLTSFTYCCGNQSLVARHMSRLVVGTAVWYIITSSARRVEDLTGICTSSNFADRKACTDGGHKWLGFDISGHAFLLVYCSLLISEEVKSFRNWDKISEVIQEEDEHPRLSEQQSFLLRSSYSGWTSYIKIMILVLTLLTTIWDTVFLATIVYFHHMPEKFVGTVIGVFCWFITYQCWYTVPSWSPGLPGQGMIKYMHRKSSS